MFRVSRSRSLTHSERVFSSSQSSLPAPTHDEHKRRTSMPSTWFEPTIPAVKRFQACALDRTITEHIIMIKSRRTRRARHTLYIGETTTTTNSLLYAWCLCDRASLVQWRKQPTRSVPSQPWHRSAAMSVHCTKSCMYSQKELWGWANLSPETCMAELKRLISEKVVASCWLFTTLY